MTKAKQSAANDGPSGMIVTVDPAFGLESLIASMRKAGFTVGERMDALNVLTVHGGTKEQAALRKLPGVISVGPDSQVHLDPREIPDMGRDFAKQSRGLAPAVSGSSWRSSNWDV